jgi:hypothetical protein
MATRRKTGERPQVRQPLKIDKLSPEFREHIQSLRAENKTWLEIEELSPKFEQWNKETAEAKRLFPGLRLPHTNLSRWYDLRVEQVMREKLAEAQRDREYVEKLANDIFPGTADAVTNALRQRVFALMQARGEKNDTKLLQALSDFGWLIAQFQKVQIQRDKVELEKEKTETAKKRQEQGITDPRELYLQVAQDVLKKLRTRKQIREVIDPIREDLIAEFAHGAEAYSKQIETRSA